MFRCQDVNLRKEYVNLVESVKEFGGDVKIFSSLHVSGERKFIIDYVLQFLIYLLLLELEQLTGIAAILRFPMPELEEDEESDNED